METGPQFEQEVRRIARLRWPEAEFSGSEVFTGQERDGVFITEDCVHLLECTMLRERAKAEKDLNKLFGLWKLFRVSHPEKAVKCWFITRHEPTSDQRACRKEIKGAPENLFNIISFSQFQQRLIDIAGYLQLRNLHKFGSIYDPLTGGSETDIKYVSTGLTCNREPEPVSIPFVAASLLDGKRFAVMGEYGVGKSMTLREVYRDLSIAYKKSKTSKFPLYLNLREHQGQQEPAEILERHGRNIGFPNPSQLVRAWKAGYAVLLLDGFDEVSSMGLQGAWRRLRDARFASMAGVRKLVLDSPSSSGIAIAGREHFFDSPDERQRALGENSSWAEIRLDEFKDEQIKILLQSFGFNGPIPSWVPARPLLLTTLFARGMTPEISSSLTLLNDASAGWDLLLDEVCNREARIEQGISGENVRAILESLATLARSKDGGMGPFSSDEIVEIFRAECGLAPNDDALNVLQRLPGLGRDLSSPENLRSFVDPDLADACRAGDFGRFCVSPFDVDGNGRLAQARFAIRGIGIGLASAKLSTALFSEGNLTAATKAASKFKSTGATSLDLVSLAIKLGISIKHSVYVSKLFVEEFEIDEGSKGLGVVTFDDCFFDNVTIDPNLAAADCCYFKDCLIQVLEGRISQNDLPEGRFEDCVIEKFESSAGTTSSVLDLEIPTASRAMITILKKLFVKSLGGRRENALYRGLDNDHQSKVPAVLELLRSQGFIAVSGRAGEPVWLPIRRQRARVFEILNSPTKGSDPVLVAARKM